MRMVDGAASRTLRRVPLAALLCAYCTVPVVVIEIGPLPPVVNGEPLIWVSAPLLALMLNADTSAEV
ncbi:MAG: hypothetical protein P8178_13905, partial [Candidatus Thiodiazotropha sp.]